MIKRYDNDLLKSHIITTVRDSLITVDDGGGGRTAMTAGRDLRSLLMDSDGQLLTRNWSQRDNFTKSHIFRERFTGGVENYQV